MKFTLINNTGYKDIRVEFDSREHFLKSGENVFENAPADLQLKVKIYDKSKVYFWSMLLLNVILFDFMVGDEIGSANAVCNSEYTISATGDECVIELSNISALAKNGVSYCSVFLNTQAQIQTAVHSINNVEHTRNKRVCKEKCVVSFLDYRHCCIDVPVECRCWFGNRFAFLVFYNSLFRKNGKIEKTFLK